jgi:hypothetical protein
MAVHDGSMDDMVRINMCEVERNDSPDMMEISIEPDLSHCICTLAHREYDRILREILSSEQANDALCEKIETLRMFLESTDFGKLRSQYEPHLAAGRRVRFILCAAGDRTEYRMEVW